MLQGQTIVGLGAPRIAGEVIGKPAVSSKAVGGNTQARGLAEEAERGGGLLQQYEGGAHARLHSPVARRDLLGPREKGQRSLRIAKRERGLSRSAQRAAVARRFRQGAQVPRQRLPVILAELAGAIHMPDFLRPRGRAPGETDGPKGGAEPERLHIRSEEHTSELQSLMRISYAV